METPQVIDFRSHEKSAPRYRYLRVPLLNINGDVALNNASQLLEFKLPSACVNMSRSYLQYNIDFTSPPAGAAAPATHTANYSFEDLSIGELAQSIQLGTAGGLDLVNIQWLQNYCKSTIKPFTKEDEFLTRDVVNSVYSSNLIGNGAATNNLPVEYNPPAGNLYGAAAGVTTVSIFKDLDCKYTNAGPVRVNGAGATVYKRPRQISLSDVKFSLLSEDKDLYSPVELYLRLYTNPINRLGFYALGNVADGIPLPTSNPTLLTGATLKNCVLYLAVQQNEEIVNAMVDAVRSGSHKFKIPYTVAFRNQLAQNFQSIQIQITSQYGKKLHHVLWTVANANEILNASCDATNFHGSKISSYQTYLDNRPLQDQTLSTLQPLSTSDVINGDDWRENKGLVENKLLNYGEYQLNWFHCDKFYDEKDPDGMDVTNNNVGLDLEAVRLYNIQATVAPVAGCTVYTYATFIREVSIQPDGTILFG